MTVIPFPSLGLSQLQREIIESNLANALRR
jgi:hypothetical protein